MKKLTSMYKRYMFHPVLYKTVTRTSIVAVLMLLWQRYVSDGPLPSGRPRAFCAVWCCSSGPGWTTCGWTA